MKRRPRWALSIAFAAVALSYGCAPAAPRIAHPVKVQSFCGRLEGRMTGVDSVMTSTNDQLLDEVPTDLEVRRAVEAGGDGLIAYWNEQPLLLPRVAKEVGETDDYVRVDAAAVPPTVEQATTRRLYLLVRSGTRKRWIALTAYDTQDVCVEGHRDV